MFSKVVLKIIFFSAAFVLTAYAADTKVICYYESWESYNGINPDNFDASLCTHVNYAFIGLWDDGNLKVEDDDLDIGEGLYSKVTDMKKKNPNLKVLLSVGGDSASSASAFAGMAGNSGKRGAFLGSATYFIETYNFDGLDIDWELPGKGDKANFITLLKELRSAFDAKGWLLTAAVSADPGDGYDVSQMNNLLDFYNVMTYDMYGPDWSDYTGQNCPLYASSVESDWEKNNLNMAAAAKNWINAGAPKSKLALGVAFYGRTYTLKDSKQHGLHAPITGEGVGEDGEAQYYDICSKYVSTFTRVWDDEQKNPYLYSGNQWISYDDKDSVWAKAAYIKSNGYAGVMIWAIDGDDIFGKCGEKQLLLKQVNDAIARN